MRHAEGVRPQCPTNHQRRPARGSPHSSPDWTTPYPEPSPGPAATKPGSTTPAGSATSWASSRPGPYATSKTPRGDHRKCRDITEQKCGTSVPRLESSRGVIVLRDDDVQAAVIVPSAQNARRCALSAAPVFTRL